MRGQAKWVARQGSGENNGLESDLAKSETEIAANCRDVVLSDVAGMCKSVRVA
jgi:hypothetical protein